MTMLTDKQKMASSVIQSSTGVSEEDANKVAALIQDWTCGFFIESVVYSLRGKIFNMETELNDLRGSVSNLEEINEHSANTMSVLREKIESLEDEKHTIDNLFMDKAKRLDQESDALVKLATSLMVFNEGIIVEAPESRKELAIAVALGNIEVATMIVQDYLQCNNNSAWRIVTNQAIWDKLLAAGKEFISKGDVE